MRPIEEIIRFGGGPQPHLPVEIGGNGFRHKGAALWSGGEVRFHILEFSDAPITHQLTRHSELRVGALLRTNLKDFLRVVCHTNELLSLVNREGERLLAVDVFARSKGGGSNNGVPVVGSTDHNRINVFALQDFAEIVILRAVGSEPGSGFLQMLLVNVTNRDDFDTGFLRCPGGHVQSAPVAPFGSTHSNSRDIELIVRPVGSGQCVGFGANTRICGICIPVGQTCGGDPRQCCCHNLTTCQLSLSPIRHRLHFSKSKNCVKACFYVLFSSRESRRIPASKKEEGRDSCLRPLLIQAIYF